ncbi:Glycosyl transferase, family 31 [Cinara cedri]|uniref:Hexosyltransferase n=1 Tax=Cinara cedri TaxID=506608 RepID=A0A5E4NH34_9HEMI|nr:Glycosyl transferase, family 31 [Cinara cedri]
MLIQNMVFSIYNLFRLKKYFNYILIIILWLVYYFGIFTHLFELDYYTRFEYPLNTNISKCVINIHSGKSDQLPCYNINTFKYELILSNNTKCNKKVYLLILVKSSLKHFERRNIIRKTWGKENRFSDVPTRTVFILGMSYDIDLQKRINDEHAIYGDIVQYDFVDEYYNNTIKTMSAIKWASNHCNHTNFFFFSDDDMYVSIKNLLRYLRNPFEYPYYLSKDVKGKQSNYSLPSDIILFTGFVFHTSPLRHQISKWYVSLSEYPYHMWPPYVTAGAYMLSHTALTRFYYGSFYTKLFRFDDIYLGILAKKLNIMPLHCEHIYFYKKQYSISNYKYVIASHGYDNSEELLDVWLEQYSYNNA